MSKSWILSAASINRMLGSQRMMNWENIKRWQLCLFYFSEDNYWSFFWRNISGKPKYRGSCLLCIAERSRNELLIDVWNVVEKYFIEEVIQWLEAMVQVIERIYFSSISKNNCNVHVSSNSCGNKFYLFILILYERKMDR